MPSHPASLGTSLAYQAQRHRGASVLLRLFAGIVYTTFEEIKTLDGLTTFILNIWKSFFCLLYMTLEAVYVSKLVDSALSKRL